MAKKTSDKGPERLSVSITFKEEERDDWELLLAKAEAAGKSRTAYAHDLLLSALHFDEQEQRNQAIASIESRLDVLTRNVARGTFLVLRADELRASGEPVPDAKEWTNQVMVLKDL